MASQTARWASQHLQALELKVAEFVTIIQRTFAEDVPWWERSRFERDTVAEPIPRQRGLQALLQVYGPETTQLSDVVRRAHYRGPLLSETPSIVISFMRARGRKATECIDKIFSGIGVEAISEEVPHPDARFRRIRYALSDPSKVDHVVKEINSAYKLIEGLLHAGSWELLNQREEDGKVRTLICKSGYLPPLPLLQVIDQQVEILPWVHGCLRFASELTTDTWAAGLAVLNQKSRNRSKKKHLFKDSSYLFQAIKEGSNQLRRPHRLVPAAGPLQRLPPSGTPRETTSLFMGPPSIGH